MIDLCLALLPLFAQESKVFPDVHPSIFVGQVWAESKCDPRAKLQTARELGVGLGQFTTAYRADGSIRFDAAAELRAQYREQLADFRGDGLRDPRLGIRALILKDLTEWQLVHGVPLSVERMAMVLSAYNGGGGGVRKDRILCGNTPGCDPSLWFGHVEITSYKSRVKWQGYGASAYEINRAYPVKIFDRALKYRALIDSQAARP